MNSSAFEKVSARIYDIFLKYEKRVFSLFFIITLLQLYLSKYIPSLDGPQHLYNANVLDNLLKGNELTKSFFEINPIIVGYWTSHFILSFFTFFLPSWLAEKLFLTVYVVFMVLSFRYFVKSIKPEKGNFISYLIFPFVFHSFILMGYYAFSMAGIFFFLAFGYYIRIKGSFKIKQMMVFSLILVGLFLTHGLVYMFFGLSFVLYYIGTSIAGCISKKGEQDLKSWFLQSIKLVITSLPSLLLWVLYMRRVLYLDNTVTVVSHSTKELILMLMRIRQLVGFHHEMESVGYIPLFVLIVILSLYLLYRFSGQLKEKPYKISSFFNQQHIWIWIASAFLFLYLFAPERISTGSLTNRFGVYFFLLAISWLSVQHFSKSFHIFTLIVVLFSITYSRTVQHKFYHNLNKDIADLTELTEYMEPNSVVYYRLSSNNWTHIHFQLYANLDKALVSLKNPQCAGQFPVIWNYADMPLCYAGDKLVTPTGAHTVGPDHKSVDIDYITIFYLDQFWNDSTELSWQKILSEDYEEIHVSKRKRAALYKKK